MAHSLARSRVVLDETGVGIGVSGEVGTRRIVSLAAMPGALCHDGRDHRLEIPPPPAPGLPELTGVFHTVSLKGLMSFTLSPPTPVT